MAQPITTTDGICFAFPDVFYTPAPPPVNEVPIPYPNIGQLSQASGTAETVLVGGNPIVTSDSEIPSSTGNEAGSNGSLKDRGAVSGKVVFKTYSQTVKAAGGGVVRMFDTTEHSGGNAVGTVLGGVPTVLVGG